MLIAVGDIEFLHRFVDHHVGGTAKLAGGIRAARRAGLADLLQESSLRRKFQNLMVFLVIAGEPYIAGPIDEDAMLALGPVVALARSTPGGGNPAGRLRGSRNRLSEAVICALLRDSPCMGRRLLRRCAGRSRRPISRSWLCWCLASTRSSTATRSKR